MVKKNSDRKIKLAVYSILVLLSLTILVYVLGFIIELLFSLNILEQGSIKVREISLVSVIFAILFVSSGINFGIMFYKKNKKSLISLHIFIAIVLVHVLYKFFEPTYLTQLFPPINYIIVLVILLVWGGVYYFLKKNL